MKEPAPAAPERKAPSERDLREAAFGCETFEGAAERLGVADLKGLLEGSKKLAAAWERGRWLREVLRVAKLGIVAAEADRYFTEQWRLSRGDLAEKLKHDRALADVWTSGQSEARLKARTGIMERVGRGEVDAKTIEVYEQLLLESPARTESLDWENLTSTELEAATGIKRAQWLRWVKDFKCPRKTSGRYSLPAVIEWLRNHEATGGVKLEKGMNPLQAEKVRRERMANDEREGRLMETELHVQEIYRRARCLAALLSPERAQEWALSFAGKTDAQLREILLPAFDKVIDEYHQIPDEVTLPPAARAKFKEGFALLRRDKESAGSG